MEKAAEFINALLFKRSREFFFSLRIRYKLVLSYFFVTLIPIIGIGFLSYNTTLTYIRSQYITTVFNTQQQFSVNISNKLKNYMYLGDTVCYDQTIGTYLDSNYADYYREYDVLSYYIRPVLTSLIESTGKNINIDLIKYDKSNAEVIVNYLHEISDSPSSQINNELNTPDKAFNIYNADRIRSKEWFIKIKNSKDYLWSGVGDDYKYGRISFSRPFPGTEERNNRGGFLIITIMLKDVIGETESGNLNSNVYNMVFDQDDTLLSIDDANKNYFGKNRDTLEPLLLSLKEKDSLFLKDYLVVKTVNEITGWKILSAFPIKELNSNVLKTRNLTIFYCIVSLLVLFVITYLLSNSFSKRIIKISNNMIRFKSGNFDRFIVDEHNDEIGDLARDFNEMTLRIKNLINDIYQANIDRKEAQLKALQAQINPHFLYNSLSSISRLGNIGDSESINKMVRALTTFYRMTLNKGKDIIKIAYEMEQIKAYVDIYKIRKGEDFKIVYDIDANVMEYYTIKVILQPFIENVLEHAIYNRNAPVNILVSAKEEAGRIVFKIVDDGIGMKGDILKSVLSGEGSVKNGYGIKNVDERIKLQYGNDYGLSVFSKLGIGTTITVVIPKISTDA